MARFLLWNVNRKPLDELVSALTREQNVELVLLVEFSLTRSILGEILARYGFAKRRSPNRFGVFTRRDHTLIPSGLSLKSRTVFWEWHPPVGERGLIALTHGPDRRNTDDHTRRGHLRKVADSLHRRERRRGHQRAIVLGDFNADPFESAVAAEDGLYAIGHLERALSRRRHQFYNPMWRAYGLHGASAGAGTFYHPKGGLDRGWHMLDQVVIRPGQLAGFPEEQLNIVTRVGEIDLVTSSGLPESNDYSDHLPLVFEWTPTREEPSYDY